MELEINKARKIINYGKQYIDNDDIDAVIETLKSDYLTTGPKINEFEKRLSDFTGYKYCSVVNNGTAALHCAVAALNLCPGDEVIVPGLTFIATANAVLYEGGKVVFADVDETLCISVESVKKLYTEKTRAIIAVDYAGQQCDYAELKKFCGEKEIILISDACHSLGTIISIQENHHQMADIVCYSFHPVKHITTGEGGAILSNNEGFIKLANSIRNHGRVDGNALRIGYNYRMSDINAALGISQLDKIIKFMLRRYNLAQKYNEKLNCKKVEKKRLHSYHLYPIIVHNRDIFLNEMKKQNIICGTHYIPVYDHTFYRTQKNMKDCKYLESIWDCLVTLPIYYSLTDEEQDYIIECVNNID